MTHTDHLQNQFGLRVAARLDMACNDLPHDISERLRAARSRAVTARLRTQPQMQMSQAVIAQSNGALLHLGDEGLNLWSRLASFIPLIALVAGLAVMSDFFDELRANELAEVDSALLVDDLPPAAYADPGFLQFLKNPIQHETSSQE